MLFTKHDLLDNYIAVPNCRDYTNTPSSFLTTEKIISSAVNRHKYRNSSQFLVAIALFLPSLIIITFVGEATAQIIPDNTLGTENSV
ncbi:hypothetical protein CEN50_23180, partial [Fischerella thermalis CCMEE 5268]